MRIFFVNRTSNPIFEVQVFETDFTENEEGLSEVRIIPKAIDPKNFTIYYYIDRKFVSKIETVKQGNFIIIFLLFQHHSTHRMRDYSNLTKIRVNLA